MSRHATLIQALTDLVDEGVINAFTQDSYANTWALHLPDQIVFYTSGEVEAFLLGLDLGRTSLGR